MPACESPFLVKLIEGLPEGEDRVCGRGKPEDEYINW